MNCPYNDYGYKHVRLSKNNRPRTQVVHRIVAKAFIENPESKPQVNHINGVKDDNRVDNLEWCTQSENMLHAYRIGLQFPSEKQKRVTSERARGEKNNKAKLTEDDVIEIRALWPLDCFSQQEVADAYDVSRYAIKCVTQNITWKHIL